jgi:hypothetical protein
MSKYLFYQLFAPRTLSTPKSRPEMGGFGSLMNYDHILYGLYDVVKNTNILLDTDVHQQKGIINDIDGGMSFTPRFYAGNNEVVDVWRAEDMKEMLTDEYFATQQIKDPQAHQRLKELLKNMEEDDNPVVVIAKMK